MYYIISQIIFILLGVFSWKFRYLNKDTSNKWLLFILKPLPLTILNYMIGLILNIIVFYTLFYNITYLVFMIGIISYNFAFIIRDIFYTREVDFSKYNILGYSVKAALPLFIFIHVSLIILQALL